MRCLLMVLSGLLAAPTICALEPDRLMDGFPRGLVVLETGHRCIAVDVWLANSPERRSRGLMFVRQLDEYEGMLFLFGRNQQISMWMKNTYIPLDMVFIRADESVESIASKTTPHSTRSVRSGESVSRVLELNAGFSARHGLDDEHLVRLIWPMLEAGTP